MTDIISLGAARSAKSQDNKDWTPRECLLKVAADIDEGIEAPTEMIILSLTDYPDSGTFDTRWYASNMNGRAMVFLIEHIKAQIIQDMQGN